MPRMQVTRVNNRNTDSTEDNFNDLIENELEEGELNNTAAPTNDSVCFRSDCVQFMHSFYISWLKQKNDFSQQNALLDLLVESDGPIDIISPASQITTINNTTNSTTNNDLLDLLGLDLSTPTNPDINTNGNNILSSLTNTTATINSTTSPHLNNYQSPLGLSSLLTSSGTDTSNFVSDDFTNNSLSLNFVNLLALDKNGLNVILVPQPSPMGDNNRCLRVIMTATNNSLSTMEQYLFQAAVPKSFTLQMLSPSGSVLPPGGTITQEMRLTSSAKVCALCSN